MASSVRLTDGSQDFSLGVDSGKPAMVQSATNPNGLPRNALAWLSNGTVRGGSIQPRNGYQSLAKVVKTGLYQGGYMYAPDFAYPYLMLSISGTIYQVILGQDYSTSSVKNITALFPGTANPPAPTQVWMAQGEKFLIIQAGDLTAPVPTLPLFWDGAKLWRSLGITNTSVGTGTPGVNNIPAAGPMVYYQGRLWYVQGRQFSAGDIVYGNSGTLQYQFRDAILNVTENVLSVGGDGFAVPSSAGNITALFYAATIDTTLGQGSLYVGTNTKVFAMTIPVTRADWISSTANNQPQQVPVQLAWGPTSDRCVPWVNSDVYYQTLEPAVRSLALAQRIAGSWADVALSRNEARALAYQDRTFMNLSTGVSFDNRLLMAIQPEITPVGAAFKGIMTLDFDILSTFQAVAGGSVSVSPAWEGMIEGLDVLQLFTGTFGGQPRCFAVVHSQLDDSIEVWELTDYMLVDNNLVNGISDARIAWYFETPAWTWAREFDLKDLDGGEIWIDQVYGTCDMTVNYRCDGDPCWNFWAWTTFCAARNSNENPNAVPVNYPGVNYCPGWKFPVTLPRPQQNMCQTDGSRASATGYQIQVQVIIKGSCRVRGMVFFALPRDRRPFEGLVCSTTPQAV